MKFDLIYADPPWRYGARITRGDGDRTRFGNGTPYPTMTNKEIIELGPLVKAITSKRAMCFMWVTKPHLDVGIAALKAWGFKYATTPFVWIKTTQDAARMYSQTEIPGVGPGINGFLGKLAKKGPGSYTNDSTEFVIVGRRGKMLTKNYHLPNGTIFSPLREHSRKPDEVRIEIENWLQANNRLEMFCRYPSDGWTVTGNGVVDEDIRDSLRRLAAL